MYILLLLEPVQLHHKFLILNLHCLYVLCFSLPSPSDFKFFLIQIDGAAHPCFFLIDGPSLVQCFRSLVLLASLAYTFTILHAIQYSMLNHDDSTTTQNPQTHDLTHYSASSSTNDTLATPSTARSAEKTGGRWNNQGINLLLNYVKQNCTLTTSRGTNLKKSDFNKAHDTVNRKMQLSVITNGDM